MQVAAEQFFSDKIVPVARRLELMRAHIAAATAARYGRWSECSEHCGGCGGGREQSPQPFPGAATVEAAGGVARRLVKLAAHLIPSEGERGLGGAAGAGRSRFSASARCIAQYIPRPRDRETMSFGHSSLLPRLWLRIRLALAGAQVLLQLDELGRGGKANRLEAGGDLVLAPRALPLLGAILSTNSSLFCRRGASPAWPPACQYLQPALSRSPLSFHVYPLRA